MRVCERITFGLVAFLCIVSNQVVNRPEPYSNLPTEQRDALAKRLKAYVEAYRERKWEKLYELVSSVGRGGVNQKDFAEAMKSEHGRDFAQMPDLLEFRSELTEKNEKGEFDIYGCAKARREDMLFNGIAVTHAVFESKEWFFTGWRFTAFPNEHCKALSDPKWQPENEETWETPMEEVTHSKSRGGLPQSRNRFAQASGGPALTQKIQETMVKILSKKTADTRTEAARHLAGLAQTISGKEVTEALVGDITSLLDSPDDSVRYWVATALGNLGPAAKSAAPKLKEMLPKADCINGAITSASGIRYALIKMGIVPPPPPNCDRIAG